MKLIFRLIVSAFLVGCFASVAWAEQAPLTYQGRLLANGQPVDDGEYTLAVELFADEDASQRICGDTQVSVEVVAGYFTHTIEDSSCMEELREPYRQVYVRVLARGGPFGDRDVEVGVHSISTGVFALHAMSGGGAVGDVVASMLTVEQFQALRGTGWVLADGGSYAGSRYAEITGRSSVPDLRGVFLRGKDHGRNAEDGRGNPGGDFALGDYQPDEVGSHGHEVEIADSTDIGEQEVPVISEGTTSEEADPHNLRTTEDGGSETRPRNVTVNYFIRIN